MSREIILSRVDGFRYLTFEPPISREELAELPMPSESIGCAVDPVQPCYIDPEDRIVRTIGFGAWIFNREKEDNLLSKYAEQVANYLGEVGIREEVEATA